MLIGACPVWPWAALAALLVAAGPARGEPGRCQRTIAGETAKLATKSLKAGQKCIEQAGPSACPDARTALLVAKAERKLRTKVSAACGGGNRLCSASDTGTDADDPPAAIGWPATCPDVGQSGCATPIGDCDDIANCLACLVDAAVGRSAGLSAGVLAVPPAGSAARRCQLTIGREAGRFAQTRLEAMGRCAEAVLSGKLPGPCPDPALAAPAIARAAGRYRAKIFAACGGSNQVCGGGDDLAPAQVGFGLPCPGARAAGASSCARPLSALEDVVACLDCVDAATTACLSAVWAPSLTPYPSGCDDPVRVPEPPPAPPATCGNGALDPGEDCDPPGSAACPNAGNGLEACSAACTCRCPRLIEFTSSGSDSGDVDLGWSGIVHDIPAVTRGGTLTLQVTRCELDRRPCGRCDIAGPVPNLAAEIGSVHNHRCTGDTSVRCDSDCDCLAAGGSCAYYFGSYVPAIAAGVQPLCIRERFSTPVTGTVEPQSGEITAGMAIAADVFTVQCPQCVGDVTANDGRREGSCAGGDHDGMPCDANGSSSPLFGTTSLDCAPPAAMLNASFSSNLESLFSTGDVSRPLTAASPNCRASGTVGLKCMCDTCNNAEATVCYTNADCVAVGATICGGRRCLGGANNGTPCTNGAQCPGGGCGAPGSTQPNGCAGFVCSPEGVCLNGPADITCGPNATFRGCLTDADCAAYRSCTGGPRDGAPCFVPADCPGGSCAPETCSNVRLRSCFPDNGVIGPHCFEGANHGAPCMSPADCPDGFCGGGSVLSSGTATLPANDAWDATLAGMPTCSPPGSAAAVNTVAGYPGPQRAVIPGRVRALP